ncbi:phosphonate C-P lyase system protein PhnH [Bordetella sp. FB-8]|uniref:phosphonate C-P lyase system protein PhnH n=1 Tax=Bordetella sp. FB-8 TaxID=1159870 RepID=UPI00036ECB21|nr:phosphonate C-P lyase system protein PhnH [Bordetella sp. FB-8]
MAAATSNCAAGAAILPGFANAPADTQIVFRLLLDALARPGRVHELDVQSGVPAGLSQAMTATLLTLIDVDAPLWLPRGMGTGVEQFLRFHCSSRITPKLDLAAFVAVPAGHALPAIAECDLGDPAYPDRSATLIIEVESLQGGPPLRLTGPGIKDEQILRVRGLPSDFLAQWRANNQRFPLGVDAILTHGSLLCGLPRTCRIGLQES